MKKFFLSLFNRGDGLSQEARDALLVGAVQGEMMHQQKTDAETQWQQELGTNYELLHDDDVYALLSRAMYKNAIVYNDEKKEWQVIERADIDFDMAALRVVVSHLNRASFISQQDAEIMRLELSAIVRRIKMQMRPDLYNFGVSNFLSSFKIFADFLLSDAIEGRKAKLVKTIPRITSVEVQTSQRKGGRKE